MYLSTSSGIYCFCFWFTVCAGVHIDNMDVPPLVELGSHESVVLDCEYTLGDSDGLVVKWFLNNKSNLVYQWIPPRKPQDIGQFKGKLDLEYKASGKSNSSQVYWDLFHFVKTFRYTITFGIAEWKCMIDVYIEILFFIKCVL